MRTPRNPAHEFSSCRCEKRCFAGADRNARHRASLGDEAPGFAAARFKRCLESGDAAIMHIRVSGGRDRPRQRHARRRSAGLPAGPGIQRGAVFTDAAADDGADMDRGRVGRCIALRGEFQRALRHRVSQLKETAPDTEFRERFVWQAPAVAVGVDLSADEAVVGYWVDNIAPCPCGR